MIFGPDMKPFYKATGEGNEASVQAILEEALNRCLEQVGKSEGVRSDDWAAQLTTTEVPIHLEKDKEKSSGSSAYTEEQLKAAR